MAEDFSVVKVGSRQKKVHKGDELRIDKVEGKSGDKLTFKEVLLTSKGSQVTVGTPTVARAKVEAKIVEQVKGKKIKIFKYKAKSRYRRRMGHRQLYTEIKIPKI